MNPPKIVDEPSIIVCPRVCIGDLRDQFDHVAALDRVGRSPGNTPMRWRKVGVAFVRVEFADTWRRQYSSRPCAGLGRDRQLDRRRRTSA
jgi:hypothetical protein